MEPSESAPALTRGVAILEHLSAVESDSLDGITRTLDFPKSSTLRLLETLCTLGLVERSEAKTYRALKHLIDARSGDDRFEALLVAELKHLVASTGETAEWYLPSHVGLTIVRQLRAEGEVAVLAKAGFVRCWGEELDAVAMLGYAHSEYAPKTLSGLSGHTSNGHREKLSAADIRQRMTELNKGVRAVDLFFNQNGVRRLAVALFNDGELMGVLAIATIHRFGHEPADDFVFKELEKSASILTQLAN